MNSIKSEIFDGVYWKLDDKSPFVYTSVALFDETLNV